MSSSSNLTYNPPTIYFNGINFNYDFYKDENYYITQQYADSHYLTITNGSIGISMASQTYFNGSIGIGTPATTAGTLNALNINATLIKQNNYNVLSSYDYNTTIKPYIDASSNSAYSNSSNFSYNYININLCSNISTFVSSNTFSNLIPFHSNIIFYNASNLSYKSSSNFTYSFLNTTTSSNICSNICSNVYSNLIINDSNNIYYNSSNNTFSHVLRRCSASRCQHRYRYRQWGTHARQPGAPPRYTHSETVSICQRCAEPSVQPACTIHWYRLFTVIYHHFFTVSGAKGNKSPLDTNEHTPDFVLRTRSPTTATCPDSSRPHQSRCRPDGAKHDQRYP